MHIAPYKDVSYAVDTVSWTDPATGESKAVHSVVSLNNPANAPTGTRYDGLRGNVYSPDNINIGQELNGLDQIAREQSLGLLSRPSGNHASVGSGSGNNTGTNTGNNPGNPNASGYFGPGSRGSSSGSTGSSGSASANTGNNPGNPNAPGYYGGGTSSSSSTGGQYHSTDHYASIGNGGSVTGLPIVLDLDGNGIDVSLSYKAAFDYDGDGFREPTAWAGPGDGFLVIDLNADGTRGAGDGKIDQAKELVLSQWGAASSTDLQALAEASDGAGNKLFDTNGDGVLSAADASFGEFRVWQDTNQNGVVDAGELNTLAAMGITQVGLTYDSGAAFSDTTDDVSVGLAAMKGSASFVRNGQTIKGGVGDMMLAHQTLGWKRVDLGTGFRIEFESGASAAHRQLAVGETDFNLGDDTTDWVSAAGNTGANRLDASAKTSAVFMDGGAGDDTLLGGSGNDVLVGGAGRDAMHGGAGNDVIYADAQDVFVAGGVAQITGGAGYDRLTLSADTAFTGVDIDALGFEAVDLSDGANAITGGKDNVNYYLDGKGGADTLTTAGGDDILIGGAGNDALTGNAGNDRLFGEAGNDTLDGGDGKDVLAGGTGADTLRGGAGDDIYFYMRGDGADTIYDHAVGTYQERFNYYEQIKHGSGKHARYVNELRTGYRAVNGEVDGGIDTLQFGSSITVEDLILSRAGADMVVQLRDDANADALEASDQITIQQWADQNNRIETFAFADGTKLDFSQILQGQHGMGGNDTLTGTADGDFLSGGNGNDTLNGNAGRDIIVGGAGLDIIDGGADKDFLFGNAGNDTIRGGAGNDYLIGGLGADTLNGGNGDDGLSGEDGADTLSGGAGNDMLLGGAGTDLLQGGAGDDVYVYFRGDGKDTIHDHHTVQETYQQATGRMVYQRSGKDGRWVAETRTATRAVQRDGGNDKLQFGFTIAIEDLFIQNNGNDLQIGIRDLADPSLGLAGMTDVVTIKDWSNAMNRIETFDFADGLSLDMSNVTNAQSGLSVNDTLTGTAGGDFLSGGHGDDVLTGLAGKDFLVGGAGNDTLDGGAGEDDLFGGAGNDTMSGGAGVDYLLGGAGNDTMSGGAGADVLTGGRGDDLLKGGRGDDIYIFNRGDGHDTIDESAYEQVTETYTYQTGNKVLKTIGSGKDKYTVWVNEVRTGTRQLTQAVEGGHDTLEFGTNIDVADLIVNTTIGGDLVVELLPLVAGGAVEDSVTINGWATPEFRVETLRFANDFAVDISGIDHAQSGGAASDTIAATGDQASWLGGGAGDDALTGSTKADILMGGAGNDAMTGGAGDDTYIVSRGEGKDVITDAGSSAVGTDPNNPGGDKLLFGAGITVEDLVLQKAGADLKIYIGDDAAMTTPLFQMTDVVTVANWANAANRVEVFQFFDGMDFDLSGLENTRLGSDLTGAGSTAPVDDVLTGTAAADWMDGFAGNDTLNAGAGDDFLLGRDGNDALSAGNGDDVLSGGKGDDTLSGGNGNDVMAGGTGNDTVNGGAGNDAVMGGSGNDTLDGGAGNDIILGDVGNDTLIASAGADVYRFGFGDGQDVYRGTAGATMSGADVFAFEADVTTDHLWFERVDNDLWVRLLGADDRIEFRNWFWSTGTDAHIAGFQADGQFLNYGQVQSLVNAMSGLTPNDGSTAYGVTTDDMPTAVSSAIDAAWVAA